jgi:hypothetical protein
MIAVIAFALFAFIIGLFSSGGFIPHQRCRKINGKDISMKILELKSVMLKKLNYSTARRIEWDQEVL